MDTKATEEKKNDVFKLKRLIYPKNLLLRKI
jgi:hypothetical protein